MTHPPPTDAQIRTAIRVLKKLSERLSEHGAHSINQLPATQFGDQYAARVEARTVEQATRIQTVTSQLEQWRDQLRQQRRKCVSHRI